VEKKEVQPLIRVEASCTAKLAAWSPVELDLSLPVVQTLESETKWTPPETDHESEARRQALLQETLDQARRQAETDAARLIEAAQRQAGAILQQAHASAAEVTRLAQQAGEQAAQKEAAGLLSLTNRVVEGVHIWRDATLAQSEPLVMALVRDVAVKLFSEGLALDAETLARVFSRSLAEGRPLGDLRIRAHPDDVALLGPLWPSQQTALSGQRIELVPNQEIERGGCFIEGQYGSVDARVKTQLGLALQMLDDVLHTEDIAPRPFLTEEISAGMVPA
jgi:flagellar biosynthesis/type III secretory pathway protein FliH